MAEHNLHQCSKEWCSVCRNRQKHCMTCDARDKDQPTECPGRPMTLGEMEAVYHGELDFKDGEWVDGLL